MNSRTSSEKIALCLSGGGFRATLFHVGSLRRLNELGVLSKTDAFVSVSGGSITNGVLATRWHDLKQSESNGVFTAFDSLIAEPIYEFCKKDIRTEVLLWDRVNPLHWRDLLRRDFSVTDRLAKAYEDELGFGVALADLPQTPRFVFCATNLENGACWEFGAREMGDFYFGWMPTGDLKVASAVAASSSYPVTFPPLVIQREEPLVFTGGHDGDRVSRSAVTLTDGGIYDNLGLEPAHKGYKFLLVSDAGLPLQREESPKLRPFPRVSRSLKVIWNQVGSVRKRWLIERYRSEEHEVAGAYWGVGSNVRNYGMEVPGYEEAVLSLLSQVRTDLDSFSAGEIACLENQGYSLGNVALRTWVKPLLPESMPEFKWPHPAFVDGSAATAALRNSGDRGIVKDLWRSIRNKVGEWL